MSGDRGHAALLDRAFPFHFALDVDGRFVEGGPRFREIGGKAIDDRGFFEFDAIDGPKSARDFESLRRIEGQVNVIDLPFLGGIRLRGEFLVDPDHPELLRFIGHPWLTGIDDLADLRLDLDDFPPHSGISDMLVNLQLREAVNKDLERLTTRLRERTEELEVELETRARLEERLQQSQKMEALGRLAGGVAHDFNNALTAISGHASMGSMAGEIDEAHRHLAAIQNAAARAADITGRLLAFARRKRIELQPADIGEIVESADGMLQPLLGSRVRFEVEQGAGDRRIFTDPAILQQAIVNLVLNARDASPPDGLVRLRTWHEHDDSARMIQESERRPGDWIVIEVSDSGDGIPAEVRDRIFEPFFTTKPLGEGTGLGLSTVWWIIERSGGVVEVDSGPEEGTSFRLHLPTVADRSTTADARAAGRGRLLLVEDHEPTRLVTADLLASHGWTVECEDSAEAALERFDRSLDSFEVLVADVVLGGMDGHRLAEVMRTRQPWLRAVLVSAVGPPEDGSQRLPVLLKPFTIERLIEAIEESTAGSNYS